MNGWTQEINVPLVRLDSRGRLSRDPRELVRLPMASQPRWKHSSSLPERSGRFASWLAFHRRRRGALAGLGLALTVTVLGVWGYGAIRRERLKPEALWEQAEADLRAGRIDRVEQAVVRLGHLRPPTPKDHMLFAQLAVARVQAKEALAELAQVPDDHYMAAQARLWPARSTCGIIASDPPSNPFATQFASSPGSFRAHRELICIYSLQLQRLSGGRS